MKFGVISPGDTKNVIEKVRLAERHGYDLFGISDTHLLTQETYTTMGVAGHVTESINIGPTVTNPVTRHPTVTASAVATVYQHTGGRAFLGISTGDSAVFTIGKKPARLAELKRAVELCNGLWRGETVEYSGEELELSWLDDAVSPSATVDGAEVGSQRESFEIPVAMAAEGPKSLELAGRIANKVVVGLGMLPEVVEGAYNRIVEGARAASRDPNSIEIWMYAHANVGPEYDTAVQEIKHRLAGVAHHSLRVGQDEKYIPEKFDEDLRELVERYEPGSHGLPDERTRELVGSGELADYLAGRYGLVGRAETCIEKIERLRETGYVDGMILVPYGDHYDEIDRIGSRIVSKI